jgi:RNA polymerase sigma-70 factor (ECF subfamily)
MTGDDRRLATTHWTCVLTAQGDTPAARAALRELCSAYYEPVRAFLQYAVDPRESSEDLAHEFFTSVLTREATLQARPQKGRFRAYLLGAVTHFLANHRSQERAQKRGGGRTRVSFEAATDSGLEPAAAASVQDSPEAMFDRAWAFTLLERALEALRGRIEHMGRGREFAVLKPWLTGNAGTPQSAVAQELDMTDGAVKVAIHRLRQQFQQAVRDEIAQTIDDPAEQAAELADLQAALSR